MAVDGVIQLQIQIELYSSSFFALQVALGGRGCQSLETGSFFPFFCNVVIEISAGSERNELDRISSARGRAARVGKIERARQCVNGREGGQAARAQKETR